MSEQATEKQLTYRSQLIELWFRSARGPVFDGLKLAEGSGLQRKLVSLALLLAVEAAPVTKQQASREIDFLTVESLKKPGAVAAITGTTALLPALEAAALDWAHLPADAEKDEWGSLTAAAMRTWAGNVLAAAQAVTA